MPSKNLTISRSSEKTTATDSTNHGQDARPQKVGFVSLGCPKNLVDSDGKNTVVRIGAAAEQIQGAAAEARVMLKKLDGPTSDFATNGLPQLTATIAQLEVSLRKLDVLVDEVERDPRAFINKPPAKQVEVKP